VPRTTHDLQIDPDAPFSQPKLLPTDLQNDLASAISDLPTELIWVEDPDIEVLTDAETGLIMDGKGITLTLGNIHVQEGGSVLVSYWLYCGYVCGIGKTFVVEEVDGASMNQPSERKSILAYADRVITLGLELMSRLFNPGKST